MNKPSSFFSGFQIFENPNLVIKVGDKTEVVNRSWKERLFSFPWRPFSKTKTIITPIYKPDPNCYFVDKYTIFCHPEIAMQLRAEIAKSKSLH